MSEPYSYSCPACGWYNGHAPDCVFREKPPNAGTRALLSSYVELRRECIALEELVATGIFTEEESNRLDRGVTLMKVGFKLVKKVLRSRGLEGRLKPDAAPVAAIPASGQPHCGVCDKPRDPNCPTCGQWSATAQTVSRTICGTSIPASGDAAPKSSGHQVASDGTPLHQAWKS